MTRWCALFSSTLLASCSTPAEPAPQPAPSSSAAAACKLTVEMGPDDGAAFRPYADNEEATLVLGFQGFRYFQSRLRLTGTAASSAALRFVVTLGDAAPATQDGGQARLSPSSDDAKLASSVLVYFNETPISELVGKDVKVQVSATAGGCTGTTSLSLRLSTGVCHGDADGGVTCADAGM